MLHRFLLPAAALILSAAPGWAQDNCQEFRAILQLSFDTKASSFVGPIYATLGEEMLIGKNLAADEVPQTTCMGGSCQDTAGKWRYDFGNGDSFTIDLVFAVYTLPGGFGVYHASEKISAGTGRFANASGVLFETGQEVSWMDNKSDLQSQYNGELGGTLCNVKPAVPAAQSTTSPAALAHPSVRRATPSARK